MKRRILALLSVLPLVAFLLLPVVASWSTSRPWTESSVTLAAGDFIAPEEAIYSTGDSTLFLRNGPHLPVWEIPPRQAATLSHRTRGEDGIPLRGRANRLATFRT
jgi:hypothetical protein